MPSNLRTSQHAIVACVLLYLSSLVIVAKTTSDDQLVNEAVRYKRILQLARRQSRYHAPHSQQINYGFKQLEQIRPHQEERSSSGQQIRLTGGSGPWEGMVEVFSQGDWMRLRANRWSERETRVVCRQLGYVSLFSKFPSTIRTKGRRSRQHTSASLDIDKCSGDEASILLCARARATNEHEVGVACYTADDLSTRCDPSEVPFGDRCYFVGERPMTRLKASIRCQQRDSALVRVTSQVKNDFLSGLMLARGIEEIHTSGYGEPLDTNTRLWFWRNSTRDFLFTNWQADGRSITDGKIEDEARFEPRCLTLRMTGSTHEGDEYASWRQTQCSARHQYICEAHRSWRECMSDNGATYSGNISTSENSNVCLSWSTVSQYPGLTSPTLNENYCRNPDMDERPWCFTSADQFEYCDIPTCPPFLPQPERRERVTCDADSFRCSMDNCVPAGYVCDGDQDCENGRDEEICRALTFSYQAFPNNDLRVQGDFDGLTRYTGRTLRNCQYMCLVDGECRLFVYFEHESMCITTSTPLGRAWPTRMSGHTVYAVLGRYTPCGTHRCDNFQCLNGTSDQVRCDGVTDCDDLSDEKDCSADYGFALRLSDGESAASGRLEARIRGRWGAVCDDLFDIDAAFVACRQLGYRRPLQFYVNGRRHAPKSPPQPAGRRNRQQDVSFDQDPHGSNTVYTVSGVLCLGNETSLAECTLLQRAGLCVDGETVSLECTDEPSLCSAAVNSFQCRDGSGCVTQPFMCSRQKSCDDGSDESEDVCEVAQYRLEPGPGPRYLSVKPAGRFFRNVTAYGFGDVEAQYVCERLGLGSYGVAFEGERVAETHQMAVMSCSEPTVTATTHHNTTTTTNTNSSITNGVASCHVVPENHLLPRASVRLSCSRKPLAPVQLRLAPVRTSLTAGKAATTEAEGLVELRPPLGEWGRLCSLAFNKQQAEVICRQLGYRGRVQFEERVREPRVAAALLAMDCVGDELSVDQCLHTAWLNMTGSNACNGSEEVYLRCASPTARSDTERPSRATAAESRQVALQCRHHKADLGRILGGSDADIDQFAWFAHIDVRQLGERRLKCGATIISQRFVLTAAHCLYRTDVGVAPHVAGGGGGGESSAAAGGGLIVSRQLFDVRQLTVVVGDSGGEVIDTGQRQIRVVRAFRHPAHRVINLYHNDLALLQLAEPLTFSRSVQPACLPPPDVSYSPQLECSVAGLGKLAAGLFGQLPGRLQRGRVAFFTRDQCRRFYGRANITAGMVCAGDDRFQVDTCDGDSGGPLTCQLAAGVTAVMAVTSWGHGCGRSDFPGVYTRVASYVDWIHQVVTHN